MIFAFTVSFLSFAHINLMGEFYISELMLLFYLVLSAGKLRLLFAPFPRSILILGGLWLLSQILTDLYRGSLSENYLRGWAAIIFFLVDFCAVYIMTQQKKGLIRVLILGSALGTILSVFALPTDFAEVEPWKFGYGPPVTMLVLLYLSAGERYKLKSSLVLLVGLGVLDVVLNARSMGGITILTAAILYFVQANSGNRIVRPNPIMLIGMIGTLVISLFGIMTVYQWAAESGYLPADVTEKYHMGKTKDAGIIGMIAGGRPEILISSRAVADSPLIGHGSWAEDAKYSNMRYEAIATLGLDLDDAYVEYMVESSDLIPVHSVIMQGWVWAGLLGAVFWLFILGLILRVTFASCFISYALQPLIIFSGISSMWNVLFSPFGANQRITWAIVIMLLFVGRVTIELERARSSAVESDIR